MCARSLASKMYTYSAGYARWPSIVSYPGPVNGSMFLVSQLSYLRGVNCGKHEVSSERTRAANPSA